MSLFSCCMSSSVLPRPGVYESKSPAKKISPKLVRINPKAAGVGNSNISLSPTSPTSPTSSTYLCSPSSNTTHSVATSSFSMMSSSPQEVKVVETNFKIYIHPPTSPHSRTGNNNIQEVKWPLASPFMQIVKEYLLAPVSQLHRSVGELNNIRDFIRLFPEEEQLLGSWLARRILAGSKGATNRCFYYQKDILEAITEEDTNYLKNSPDILGSLTFQKRNVRSILTRKMPLDYLVLAGLMGQSELSLFDSAMELSNSLEGEQELRKRLKDRYMLYQVARNADEIAAIDLRASIAGRLIIEAYQCDPTKGLALLCRSLSDYKINNHSNNHSIDKIDQFIVPIAQGFIAHLKDPAHMPPMTMALNSPLWRPIHEHLKKYYPKDRNYPLNTLEPAMEWFIASINLATKVNCDLLKWLKGAGYSLKALTPPVRDKITCLCLDKEAREEIPKFNDFISSFKHLRVLRLADPCMLEWPKNFQSFQSLLELTLTAPHLFELPPIPNLEYLCLIDTKARLPECLLRLKVFIGSKKNVGLTESPMPRMPNLKILEIDGYNWHVSNTPHLKRLIVNNNERIERVSEDVSLEVLYINDCRNFRRLFPQIESWEIPEKLGIIQPHLQFLTVTGALGDPSIEGYCNAWNRRWMIDYVPQ